MNRETASANGTLYATSAGVLYMVPNIDATDESGYWTQGHRWIASRDAFAKRTNDLNVDDLTLI